MLKKTSLNRYSSLVRPLVYLFPFVILGRNSWGASILILLTFFGAYIAFKEGINPFKHQKIKLISILTVAYFSSLLFFTILSERSHALIDFTGGELFFLFAPFIALSIHMADINLDRLVLVIKLALTVLGIVILFKSTQTINVADRVLWVSHIGVMLLVFSWINILHENKYNLLLTFISSTLALNAIMIGGTRGPLLALIVLSILLIYLFNRYSLNKYRILVSAVALVLISSFFMSINDNIRDRFYAATDNLHAWQIGSDIKRNVGNTSTGQRMEMYKSGLLSVKDKPFLGYGYKNTVIPTSKYTSANLKQYILQHTHLHNTYINTLVYGGVTALLVTLILLCFLPFKIFWRAFNTGYSAEYSIMGILLITSYALLGMTDTMLGGGDIFESAFFIFFLSLFLPKVI